MRAFMREQIDAAKAQQAVLAAVHFRNAEPDKPTIAARPIFPPKPGPGDISEGPKPAPKDPVKERYGEFAQRFADPDAFLDRIRDGEPGVERMANIVMENPDIGEEVTADRFESLLGVRNNVFDTPDERKFLQWGMTLRENELDFVAAMGNMTSSRMKDFARNARLVFGGPSALNANNPELVKVAKMNLRFESQGTANKNAYLFATQMSAAKLSPVRRAREFVAFCTGLRQREEIQDIREDLTTKVEPKEADRIEAEHEEMFAPEKDDDGLSM